MSMRASWAELTSLAAWSASRQARLQGDLKEDTDLEEDTSTREDHCRGRENLYARCECVVTVGYHRREPYQTNTVAKGS